MHPLELHHMALLHYYKSTVHVQYNATNEYYTVLHCSKIVRVVQKQNASLRISETGIPQSRNVYVGLCCSGTYEYTVIGDDCRNTV